MNGYEVFKVQPHPPHKRGMGEGPSDALHLMHSKQGGVGVEIENSQKNFFGAKKSRHRWQLSQVYLIFI